MNYTTQEIEKAIDEILALATQKPERKKKKRGRKQKEYPVWALEFYNPAGNRSFALISMCIKDDFDQSIEQLALKLSATKQRPPMECLTVLRQLSQMGKLGYYDDNDRIFRAWYGKENDDGLESMCG